MTETGWKIRLHYNAGWDANELYIRRGSETVQFRIDPYVPGELHEPAIRASREDTEDGKPDALGFLRAALNSAWELGLRPDGFNDTRESMAATKQHLEDMRALAFYKIGAEKPAKPTT